MGSDKKGVKSTGKQDREMAKADSSICDLSLVLATENGRRRFATVDWARGIITNNTPRQPRILLAHIGPHVNVPLTAEHRYTSASSAIDP